MSDDDYESVSAVHRRAVSSGEASLDGSVDEERTLSDTEIARVVKTKELATQVKGPSSDALEAECEKARVKATKDEINEGKSDEYVGVDEEGFEDILGSGHLWKKTIKEGKGEKGSPSQWANIKVKDLSASDEEILELRYPLGYHYIIDALELVVQLMKPEEKCLIKSSPRFVSGVDSKELIHKYEIELVSLEGYIDFDKMSSLEINQFLQGLKDRAAYYFQQMMIDHALQLNIKALDIISKELEDEEEYNAIKLEVLIDTAHYYYAKNDAVEGLRIVEKGLAIDNENIKLKYKKSQFHFMKKEFKESAAVLKFLIAKGIKTEIIQNALKKTEACVKEQLEKEKEVCKRMLGALGKPPKKESQLKRNGYSPAIRYFFLALTVVLIAVMFHFIRYYFDLHYFNSSS